LEAFLIDTKLCVSHHTQVCSDPTLKSYTLLILFGSDKHSSLLCRVVNGGINVLQHSTPKRIGGLFDW
jgi:hypothetical protein